MVKKGIGGRERNRGCREMKYIGRGDMNMGGKRNMGVERNMGGERNSGIMTS